MPRSRNLTPCHPAIAFSPESEFDAIKAHLDEVLKRWPPDRHPRFVELLRAYTDKIQQTTKQSA